MLELETRRLIIRDLLPDDLHLITTLAADPRVTRYQPYLRLHGHDACRRWLTDAMRANAASPRIAYSMAVVLRDGARPIGWLDWSDATDRSKGAVSFGYALLPEMWRHGYMTEAVRAMLKFVFGVQQHESAYASCAAANRASAGVLQRSGMRLVARYARHDEDLDIEEEHLRHRIDRSDWRATPAGDAFAYAAARREEHRDE